MKVCGENAWTSLESSAPKSSAPYPPADDPIAIVCSTPASAAQRAQVLCDGIDVLACSPDAAVVPDARHVADEGLLDVDQRQRAQKLERREPEDDRSPAAEGEHQARRVGFQVDPDAPFAALDVPEKGLVQRGKCKGGPGTNRASTAGGNHDPFR